MNGELKMSFNGRTIDYEHTLEGVSIEDKTCALETFLFIFGMDINDLQRYIELKENGGITTVFVDAEQIDRYKDYGG